MKRLIVLLLVVLMSVSLCGCAEEKSKVPEPGTALNTFYQAIMAAQAGSFMHKCKSAETLFA